jgi:hypothetical protein
MSKVIIALLVLIFSFTFLLLIWIIFLTLALLFFSKKERGETRLAGKQREIKGESRDGTGLLGGN